MRFEFNMKAKKEIKPDWRWYDHNNSTYKKYEDDEDSLKQLEVSFLGNVKSNYDPVIHDEKFNDCLLPKLRYYFENRPKDKRLNRDYIFRAKFSDQDGFKNNMANMEE